jgi:hypothetical protein
MRTKKNVLNKEFDITETNMAQLLNSEVKRLDNLREAEVRRIDEKITMHAEYEEKLTLAEQKRLDAIRSVDVAAVSTASERAILQAQVLAKNVTESAETLRQLVAQTASNVAEQLKTISTQLADRLLIVEKAQYELKGKTAVEDPMRNELREEIKSVKDILITHVASTTGTGTGRKEMYGWIIGGIMTLIAIIGFLTKVL